MSTVMRATSSPRWDTNMVAGAIVPSSCSSICTSPERGSTICRSSPTNVRYELGILKFVFSTDTNACLPSSREKRSRTRPTFSISTEPRNWPPLFVWNTPMIVVLVCCAISARGARQRRALSAALSPSTASKWL